jgi:hypothetical protein
MNVIELNEGWSFKQKDTDDEWLLTSVPTKYVESLLFNDLIKKKANKTS